MYALKQGGGYLGGNKMLLQKIDCSGAILNIRKIHFLKIALYQGGGEFKMGVGGGGI